MVKKSLRKSIEKSKSNDYRKIADNFYNGSETARTTEYWNAAGVLIIHSAIAYADAITIKYGGVKSQGENHYQAVFLLKEILPDTDDNKKAFNHFEKLIVQKTSVSYSGNIYNKKDIDRLWNYLNKFKSWAVKILNN